MSSAHRTGAAAGDSIGKGSALAFFAFMVFSMHDAVIKSLAEYSVFQIMFFAALFAYVPFATSLALDRTPRSLRPVNPGWVVLRGCTLVGSAGFVMAAFTMLPMVQVYVMLFLVPSFVSLLAIPLLGEKIRLFRSLAIAVGFIGVLIVLRPGADSFSLGHLFGLCGAACAAVSNVIARKVGRQENPGTMIVVPMLINVAVTGGATILVYQPMVLSDLLFMFLVGALGIIAQYTMLIAYRSAPSYIVAPFQYTQVIWAVLFGALLFGDSIDSLTLLGSAITIGSGLVIVWRELRVSINQPNLHSRNIRGGALAPMQSVEQDEAARTPSKTD